MRWQSPASMPCLWIHPRRKKKPGTSPRFFSYGDGCFHYFDYLCGPARYYRPACTPYFDIVDLTVFPRDTSLCTSKREQTRQSGLSLATRCVSPARNESLFIFTISGRIGDRWLGSSLLSFLLFLPLTDTRAWFQSGNCALRKQRTWLYSVSTAENGTLHEKMTLEQILQHC
jgi:hypothetical protein